MRPILTLLFLALPAAPLVARPVLEKPNVIVILLDDAGYGDFAHTGNPQPSLWHARDYGLLAANPFGRKVSGFPAAKDKTDLYRIEKGKAATFRFAIFAHDGDVKDGKVADAYDAYVSGRN